MDFLFDGIATVLSYLYDLTSSFGGAIMLLTLVVMVAVTPLTLKSTRSMIAMQQLQPELRKLQAKHKDDRQKLNEEMMAFYKEHDINPLGGCLPLIVQMPVFIVLYRVLTGLTKLPGYGEDMGHAVGLAARTPEGGGRYEEFGTFDPGYLDSDSGLFEALDPLREMRSFGLDLADTFTNRFADGLVSALPYLVLVVLIGVTAWYQQRQIQARNSGNQPQINPQQQALLKIMPFFLPVISLTLPAGIVLYFLVSNLYRIGQQGFITRTMYSEKAKEARAKAAASRGKSGGGDRSDGDDGDAEDSKAVSRRDTVPKGSRGLLGGLIHLPAKSTDSEGDGSNGNAAPAGKGSPRTGDNGSSRSNGAVKGTGKGVTKSPSRAAPARSSTATKSGTKAPARKAPPRPPSPANKNRAKTKKKRK